MTLLLLVYALGFIPQLTYLLYLLCAVSAVAFVVCIIRKLDLDKELPSWFKKCCYYCIAFAISITLLPNEKTAYLMVGAYATQQVVESDIAGKVGNKLLDSAKNTTEISGKIVTIINQKLDAYIAEGVKK